MDELLAIVNGEVAAVVEQQRNGELTLTYDRSWRDRADSFPLSLSMPLSRRKHGNAVVQPFMEGLLPDNDAILQTWARRFHVSSRNPFSLLAHMGEDCAGAAQFVRPDRQEEFKGLDDQEVAWLTEEDVAVRLRDLVEHHGIGRLPGDRGQFSLAGAQPKMALLHDGTRWGIPAGATPSTHILKPPAQLDLEAFDINEHLCLRLASEIGLTVTRSTVRTFAGQEALVVERYDRFRQANGRVIRIHQEDACQALAISPYRKYQNEGGPGPADIVNLLFRESSDPETDIGTFLDVLAFNWLIAGTDAHAKNYSLLLSSGSVRLAPLYDLISVFPYPRRVSYRQAKLAMSIDREYDVWKIRRRHWEGLAVRCDLDPQPVLERTIEFVAAMPQAAGRAAEMIRQDGIRHPIIDQLEASILDHSEQCLRYLTNRR